MTGTSRRRRSNLSFVATILYALLCLLLLVLIIRLAMRPERCPSCKARAIQNWRAVASSPAPSPWYYRCENCGLRLRRLFNGPWEDASAAKYDVYYKDAPPLPLALTGSYRRRD
jgi:hypothetical protein